MKYFLNDCRKNHFNTQTEAWNLLVKPKVKIAQFPKYIIIDDDTDMLDEQLPFFINTDPEVGITDEDVKTAIKILND